MKQNLKENKEEKMTEAYIIDAARTPRGIGKLGKGSLSEFHPGRLLATVLEEIQKRNFLITMETISSIPLFSMLPIGALSKINDKLVAEIYPAKRKIIEKGDAADCMYIIEFGSVQVEIESPVTLGQGDYFGEKGILSKELRNASISSLEEVKLLSLSKEDLEDTTMEWAKMLSKRSSQSLNHTKKLMRESLNASYWDTFNSEAEIQNELTVSAQNREAVKAFLEKREPNFD